MAASGLPSTLVSKAGGNVATADALAGKDYIGVYFSAHWCPPCRAFTPVLSKWYEQHGAAKKIALIFASNDKDQASMTSYFSEMSWDLAIPFDDKSISALGKKFKVQGIPTLVILDKEGNMVTPDGREGVMRDADGSKFPWRPPTVEDILTSAGTLTDKSGASFPVSDTLGKKYLALYFSAHWCPPCRQFTPKAAAWYTDFMASGKAEAGETEVVFVSSDKDEKSYREYLGEMPWKALPLEAKEAKQALASLFKVSGIPKMILLKKDRASGTYEVETDDLRSKILSDPDSFPWPAKACESIDNAVDTINDTPTLVAFTDKMTDGEAEKEVVAAMEAVAADYFRDGEPSEALRFAVARESDDATEQVRQFCGGGKDKDGPKAVRVVLVDVPGQGKVDMPLEAGALPTADQLRAFAADYVAGKLKLSKFR